VELPSDEDVESAIDEGTPVEGGDPVVSTDGVPAEPGTVLEAPAGESAGVTATAETV
jgi:hypothetical protein